MITFLSYLIAAAALATAKAKQITLWLATKRQKRALDRLLATNSQIDLLFSKLRAEQENARRINEATANLQKTL